jgi:hypothetical protein
MDLQQAKEILESIKFGPPFTNLFAYRGILSNSPTWGDEYFCLQVWLNDRISQPIHIHVTQVSKEHLYTNIVVCCQQILSSLLYESYTVPNLSVDVDSVINRE